LYRMNIIFEKLGEKKLKMYIINVYTKTLETLKKRIKL
jgi:hypothetical protein